MGRLDYYRKSISNSGMEADLTIEQLARVQLMLPASPPRHRYITLLDSSGQPSLRRARHEP
eukprot:6214454-Pleurochrysis_carterae.AAC.1